MAEDDKKAAERRAAAHVAMQFKQQQADQTAEHRRQTSRLRAQHRQQLDTLHYQAGAALERPVNDLQTIKDRETQALKEFDSKRRSLAGRTAEIAKGKAHFDAQREEIQQRFDDDRLENRYDYEAVTDHFRAAKKDQHFRQVHERKAMFIEHRQARLDLQSRQDRDRPRLVAERLQAVARNAEIERSHQQERTKEKRFSLRSEFGRG